MAKILVVDDDPAQRARLKHTLGDAGYRVTTAPDAIQGLVAITRDRPDLILSDILMPRMDGFTFIREVKSRPDLRTIPFLFVTSTLVSDDDLQFAQMLGVEAIVARTDDPAAALGIVESCLKRHAHAPAPPTHAAVLEIPATVHPERDDAASRYVGAGSPRPYSRRRDDASEAKEAEAKAGEEGEEKAAFWQQYGEQKVAQLQAQIAELEQANRALEQRTQELAAAAASRDQRLQTAQAHAADLEARVAEHAQRLAALAEISSAINASLNPEPLLDEIVQRAASLVRVAECNLFLYNPETDTFHGAASSARARAAIRQLVFPKADALQIIGENRAPVALCAAAGNHPFAQKIFAEGLTARAMLFAPLTAHDQLHGFLLCADATAARAFGDEEITVVAQLADQAALALENARLLYESSRRLEELRLTEELRAATLARVALERAQLIERATAHTRQLEQQLQERKQHVTALARISKAINTTLDPEAVLDQIVAAASRLIRVDTCNLFLFNPESHTFHGVASSSLPRESIQQLFFSENNNAPVRSLVQSQAAVALSDADQDPAASSFPILHDTFHAKAALITPVVACGQMVGVLLCVDSNAHRAFTPEETELLAAFADQAANALENARLFYEATRALDALNAAQQQLAQAETCAAAAARADDASSRRVGAGSPRPYSRRHDDASDDTAHALSQPLRLILGQARRLRQQVSSPELTQALDLIEAQTRRMVEMVEQNG